MKRPKGVIVGVDVLRFLSAVLVVFYHLSFHISKPGSTPYRITENHHFYFAWSEGTASIGRIGVEIFFVISGFVIAYTARKGDAMSFVRSRILRLAPAAWICASITLAVALFADTRSSWELLKAWVRAVGFFPVGPYVDAAFWTLGIECAFYAIVLVLILVNALRHMDKVFFVIGLISTLFCVTVLIIRPEFEALTANRYLQLALIVHGCEFALGVFVWGLLFEGYSRLRAFGTVIVLIGSCIEVWGAVPRPEDALVGLIVFLLCVAGIVASVIFNDQLKAQFGAPGVALMRAVGIATYPLYLVHTIVGAALMATLARYGVPDIVSLFTAILAMVALAYIIAAVLEPIIRNVLSSLLDSAQRRWKLAPEG